MGPSSMMALRYLVYKYHEYVVKNLWATKTNSVLVLTNSVKIIKRYFLEVVNTIQQRAGVVHSV
jgi:hypothetical protein